MSSTNRGAKRVEADGYQTPPELADFLVRKLLVDGFVSSHWGATLEPHAGDGAFLKPIRFHMNPSALIANELHLNVGRATTYGAVQAGIWEVDFATITEHGWYAIIGNPPYSLAEDHIRHALKLVNEQFGTVAFLLRLAFLESRSRLAFWKQNPLAKVYALAERPSFTGGQTDSSAYGFFVWSAPWNHKEAKLEVVSWKPERANPKRANPKKFDPNETFPSWPEE